MSLKDIYKDGWKSNFYKASNLRGKTTENGNTTNRFSYDEFKQMTGITVNEYDLNKEKYKDYTYSDFIADGKTPTI